MAKAFGIFCGEGDGGNRWAYDEDDRDVDGGMEEGNDNGAVGALCMLAKA